MKPGINNSTLDAIRRSLAQHYPTLHLQEEYGDWFIRGLFPVKVAETIVDRYLIEIKLHQNHPQFVPSVCERGGRIPKHVDWHIDGNGYCCLFVHDERWKYWPRGATFLEFLTGPVNDFFLSQIYHDLYGVWPFGERSHGIEGILEYYTEELGTNDIVVIMKLLKYLSAEQPKGHWSCYCGSSKKMRHCHLDKIRDLHARIDSKTAKFSRNNILVTLVYILRSIAKDTGSPHAVSNNLS